MREIMAKTLTLDDLKAENAAAEDTDTSEIDPQTDGPDTDANAAEANTLDTGTEADSVPGDNDITEADDWTKPDGHTPEPENVDALDNPDETGKPDASSDPTKLFTGRDIKAAKTSLRAKLERQHNTQIDELNARIASLENPKTTTQKTELAKPTRDQFFDADDPDEAYVEALTDYRFNQFKAEAQAENATTEISRKQAEQTAQINLRVDEHYLRAVKLAEQSGISATLYQSSDLAVRQMIEGVFPEGGDAITDALISRLGAGSEKVLYNLGVNKTRLNELREHLIEDNSGVSAAMYLGSLRETLTSPSRRKTNAPKPAATTSGDKQSNSQHRALQKAYDAAHHAGDAQAAFNARREAKAQGADTSQW